MELSQYEKFAAGSKNVSFMQSECWSKVKQGWESEQVILTDDNGKELAAAQLLFKKFSFLHTSFAYAPRGPVCDVHDKETLAKLTEKMKEVAAKHHAFLIRVDPMVLQDDKEAIDNLNSVGFRQNLKKTEDDTIQSLKNYVLPLEGKTEEEIFQNFHPKWRYNVRTAIRKGVECVVDNSKVDDFFTLMQETGTRDHFHIRPKEYFELLLSAFGENARLYMCYSPDHQPLSGALSIRFGDRVNYVYGASTQNQRNLMPNYLMQWSMIQWAIQSGCRIYDFMGVPHYEDESHSNYGVYRFKKGFNGHPVTYAGEFDMVRSRVKCRLMKIIYKICGYHSL